VCKSLSARFASASACPAFEAWFVSASRYSTADLASPQMADRSPNDLNYGRPGLANYDLENREWTFSRQPAKKKFVQISPWRPVLAASTTYSNDGTFSSAARTRRKARRLVRNHSQLVPASEQLHGLQSVSEAILSTTSTYDPVIGNLLSFGSVFLERSGTVPKRIAALPAGEAGNILRLVVLREERHGWSNDKTVWLSGPSFKNADSGYWNEDAAPIQQVCFAQTENGHSFLALRLPMKTVVFSPIYHRGRRAAKQSPYHDLPPSLIDAHPITSISIEQTGGAPHSDVTFNPDYQFQVGIVDQQSAWSIWDIDRKARDKFAVSCMVRGDIIPPEESSDIGEDGWARILWAGDINTVLVCNRRHLSIIDIKGPSFVYLPSPVLFTSRSAEWILDVQRHPKHNNRFFVLTSTHILVLGVTTSSAAMDMTTGEAGAHVLLSRRHYQGEDDFTLQLSVHQLLDNGK
jgi:RNA polymerase I-specific transcription initiation factor RRN6